MCIGANGSGVDTVLASVHVHQSAMRPAGATGGLGGVDVGIGAVFMSQKAAAQTRQDIPRPGWPDERRLWD